MTENWISLPGVVVVAVVLDSSGVVVAVVVDAVPVLAPGLVVAAAVELRSILSAKFQIIYFVKFD